MNSLPANKGIFLKDLLRCATLSISHFYPIHQGESEWL